MENDTVDLEFTLRYIAENFGEGYIFDFMDKLEEIRLDEVD